MNWKVAVLIPPFLIGSTDLALATNYVSSVLYPITQLNGYFSEPTFVSPNETGGYGDAPGNAPNHALLWTSNGVVDLNPTQLPGIDNSIVNCTSGSQQVGSGSDSATGGIDQALLWNSTAASAVNLNPTNLGMITSDAAGTNGTQQVGAGAVSATNSHYHALLWTGSASSAVDLNPAQLSGMTGSFASATDGTQQVGYCMRSGTGLENEALLWSGTAASAVDLAPTNLSGFIQTFALGVGGNQQVGWGFNQTRDKDEALLWTGSAATTVDLNPTNLSGIQQSTANSTNGEIQVGFGEVTGTSDAYHALVWSGTANSAVDLQSVLSPNGVWSDSEAFSIDSYGDIFGIASGTFDGVTGDFAVEWSVPEPATGSLLVITGAGMLMRRRRQLV